MEINGVSGCSTNLLSVGEGAAEGGEGSAEIVEDGSASVTSNDEEPVEDDNTEGTSEGLGTSDGLDGAMI